MFLGGAAQYYTNPKLLTINAILIFFWLSSVWFKGARGKVHGDPVRFAMTDKETVTTKKVPLLGDIPVVGWLFKNKERRLAKVNLLFFLTPKILSTYERKTAKTLKNLLNRRSLHLKSALGENDPFKTTVKQLYKKAKKQDKGPLFDKEDGKQYRDSLLNQTKLKNKKPDLVNLRTTEK